MKELQEKLILQEDTIKVRDINVGDIVGEFDSLEDAQKFIDDNKDNNYEIVEELKEDEKVEDEDGRISKKMLDDMNLDVDAIEQEIKETQLDLVDVPNIEDVNNGMYTIISQEMRDTLQDIENLKSIIVTLKAEDAEREAWAIESLESIIDERTIHVGMLQSILDSFDNDTKDLIDKGVELTLEEPKENEEKEPIDVLKDKIDVHGEEDTIVITKKGQLDNPDAPKIEVEVTEEEKEILEPEFHEDKEIVDTNIEEIL